MSFLILPMFILLIVLAGLTLDIYVEEAYREDLQDAVDRGVLSAGAPHQNVDCETVVRHFIDTRTYNDKTATSDINCTREDTFSEVSAGAGFDMDTIIFSLLYTNTLPIIASSRAFEGEFDLEISLVLDISGSMSREISTGTTQKRLDVLKGAAKAFVTEILARPNAERVSISIIPYAGQVNAGPFFDKYVDPAGYRNNETWAGRCVDFADADFNSASMPALASLPQTPQFQNFRFEGDYGNNAVWGWCPTGPEIIPFSNSESDLHDAIDAFVGHDGTGTNNGVKWGLGMLDPAFAPVLASVSGPGGPVTLEPEIVGRPGAYGNLRVKKYMVVMTDGNIRYQNRPKAAAVAGTLSGYPTVTAEWLGSGAKTLACNGYNYSSTRNTLSRCSAAATLSNSTARNNDEALRSQQFLDVCSKAREKGVRVFTIGFDISSTSDAYSEMRNCATSTSDFFDVEGTQLYSAFEQIAQNIAKLQLVSRLPATGQ